MGRPGLRQAILGLVLSGLLVLQAIAAPAPAPELDLQGPLADFWARVRRDWDKRLTSLNRGPLQTAIWVAMVWDGPDDLRIEQITEDLQERESRRWVRAQITRHRWSEISGQDYHRMQALRHNVILLGTPGDNELVARALSSTPIRIEPGLVTIGDRRLEGDGLLVVAITPSPVAPGQYALVFTGSSPSSLLAAGQVAYGESDYVVFRGQKILERGLFSWKSGRPVRDSFARAQPFEEHFGWTVLATDHYRLHHDPAKTPPARAARLGGQLEDLWNELVEFYHLDAERIEPIDIYVYASVDEKVNQTADSRPAHLDRGSLRIHAVLEGDRREIEPSLIAGVMLTRSTRTWGPNYDMELPGLASAVRLACREEFEGIPLQRWAARSGRDRGWMPMDILFARGPSDPRNGEVAHLEAAAFVRRLILEHGIDRVAAYLREARRSDFRSVFKDHFGLAIAEAEREWIASLPAPPAPAVAKASTRTDSAGPPPPRGELLPVLDALERRDHAEAERLLAGLPADSTTLTLRARIYFRTGRFGDAIEAARQALSAPPGDAVQAAWARLTLGRAHAMSGHLLAASLELKHPDITLGPPQVSVIAEFWLERLGQPLNRRSAETILMQEADTDLMNFQWEQAEQKLRQVLAANPENREAHATLGEVYLSKYQYWYDWLLLDKELFPAESMSDPETYKFLADKGRAELRMAEQLPFGEQDRWLAEHGPVEPGLDQAAPHFLLGKVHFLKGNLNVARKELETALSLEPRKSSLAAYCRLYLGRIAAAEQDETAARQQFDTVVRMNVSEQVTKLARQALLLLDGGSPREAGD